MAQSPFPGLRYILRGLYPDICPISLIYSRLQSSRNFKSGLDATGALTLAQQARKVRLEHGDYGIEAAEISRFYTLDGSGALDGSYKDFVLGSW